MFPICDIVIYNKDIVGLPPVVPGTELQKPLEFPDLSLKGVFCYVNDVTSGTAPKLGGAVLVARGANPLIRGSELSIPAPLHHLGGGERGWRLCSITNGQ